MTRLNINILHAGLPVLLLLSALSAAHAQNDRKFIRQGNDRYSDARYQESEIAYRKAIDANKMSGDAVFNLGNALYRQNKYEDAGKQFLGNAEVEPDRKKKAGSFYNLGNTLLQAQKIEESIGAYKNSLRLDPSNQEAKYNLAYAQDLLKQQEQEQQKNQDQEKNDQDKNENNKDKENQQNEQKQDNSQQQQNQDPQKQDQQQQQQQQQQISKEDAQRLLDALANDEKKVQEKVQEAKAARARVRTLINW